MQNKNEIQDFDLQIRSMLEDASVKAPKSVWKAVSARLGEADAAPIRWAWAGAGLAFAAVLAAGLFFAGTFRKSVSEDTFVAEASTLRQTADTEPAGLTVSVIPATSGKAGQFRCNPQTTATAMATAPATAMKTETTPTPATATTTAPATATAPAPAPATAPDTAPERESAPVDPFAAMEREDAAARKIAGKPSILLGGILAGNNAEGTARTWMGVDGKASESLLQTGVSSYGIPVSFGLGVRIPVCGELSIGTGLNYSLLTTNFAGTYKGESGNVHHNMHYVGLPLNLYYKVIQLNSFKVFLFGGGEADLCVASRYRFDGNGFSDTVKGKVDGLMFSVDAGVGFNFDISRKISLYVDPSVKYWFPNNHPDNIRTSHPFGFNVEAGLRFNL